MEKCIIKGIKIGLMIVIGIFIFGTVLMLLWNVLMPSIFGLREISFWEGIGLLILAKIFFGSHYGGRKHCKHCHGSKFRDGSTWKMLMKEKMKKMSEEEKIAFKQKLGKCGAGIEDEDENS